MPIRFRQNAASALQDGTISKAEADGIEREVAEAITALHRLTREAQAAVAKKRSA